MFGDGSGNGAIDGGCAGSAGEKKTGGSGRPSSCAMRPSAAA